MCKKKKKKLKLNVKTGINIWNSYFNCGVGAGLCANEFSFYKSIFLGKERSKSNQKIKNIRYENIYLVDKLYQANGICFLHSQ